MKILVAIYSPFSAWNIPAAHVESLRRAFPTHTFEHARTEEEVHQQIAEADVAFASELRRAHFDAAKNLRWVHSPAAGVGGMLLPDVIKSPIVISNSRGMSGDTIAEHIIALTLALFRKLPLFFQRQTERRWAQDEAMAPPPLRTIAGCRVLLIGVGGIGAATARRFASLGATVTAVRRHIEHPVPEGVAAVLPPERLVQSLADADVVVLAAPQTGQTRRLIAAAELRAMRADALLINVSRGKLVDEGALAEAIASRTIGGAGLDVFEDEPLDPASPLWRFPNVIVTPHMAGFRADHWDAAAQIFADNLRRFDAGEPLRNVVDKTAGY